LEIFFRQWLHTPGIPQLHASWQYDTRKKEITFTVRQLQATAFTVPLEIEWILPGGTPTRKTLLLDGKEKSVTYKVAAKPVRVNLDPDTALLFEGNLEER
jgi:aminopeptidase N